MFASVFCSGVTAEGSGVVVEGSAPVAEEAVATPPAADSKVLSDCFYSLSHFASCDCESASLMGKFNCRMLLMRKMMMMLTSSEKRLKRRRKLPKRELLP